MISRRVQVQQRQHMVPRRRRFEDGGGGGETAEEPPAGCGCRSSSCAAVVVADCVALGCCPCAVVSQLGLALVRAPLAVCRRCVRRRRRVLTKRVRHVPAAAASTSTSDDGDVREKQSAKAEAGDVGVDTTGRGGSDEEEELAWLEEMYRTGNWGFGRVSFSANTP